MGDIKVTVDDFIELMDALNELLNCEPREREEEKLTDRERFEREFNRDNIIERFSMTCGTVMSISSLTGIDLDKTLDMFVDEMRKELQSEDTKAMMKAGDDLLKRLGLV